jgi:hypothetical protein
VLATFSSQHFIMTQARKPSSRRIPRSSRSAMAQAVCPEPPIDVTATAIEDTQAPEAEATTAELPAPAVPAPPVPEQQDQAPEAPEAPATEPEASQLARIETTELATSTLPALDMPSANSEQPAVSYKPPFKWEMANGWICSTDGGKTNTNAGTAVVAGCPVDLRLEITPAAWPGAKEGSFDFRLRFMFISQDGILSELNLNALNPSREDPNVKRITGPARSLLGGLKACCDSEDDSLALHRGFRATIKPGNLSTFVDLDVVHDIGGAPSWVSMGGPAATRRIGQGAEGLVDAVKTIKARLVTVGVFMAGPAVHGEIPQGYGIGEVLESAAV